MSFMNPFTSPYSDSYIKNQIQDHPLSDSIRNVQNKSYKATSYLHKNGLDAASWLLGPFASIGFAATDDHRQKENQNAIRLLDELIQKIDMTERSQIIMLHLGCTYPGRLNAEYPRDDGLTQILKYLQKCQKEGQLKVDTSQFDRR